MLGSIVGGTSKQERERCATEVSKRNVAGDKCSCYCLNYICT